MQTNTIYFKLKTRGQQEGVVLVTTLFVLAVVSLLVASMMLTSGSEEKMAFNAQTRNQTFQAAESAMSAIINSDGAMFEAIDGGGGGQSSVEVFDLGISRLNSESFIEYKGKGLPIGASLGSAVTYKFEAEGRGFIDDNSIFNDADDEAKSRLLQGMYRISYVAEQ